MSSVILRRISKVQILKSFQSRFSSHQAPFSLEHEDDKYEELNQMYSHMFTQEVDPSTTKKLSDATNETVSILEELNTETEQLLNVEYRKLSAEELEHKVKTPGKIILQSLSHNPFYNLALENYIFNNTPSNQAKNEKFTNQRLLFYVNTNCVVIGKNQTVWREVYSNNLASKGYDLLRRFSGGGTVVHDLGNVNYSFITSRDEFEREFFNKLIVKWLRGINSSMPLGLNSRGDIVLRDRKISGSAFKIAKGKAYHHGTMLINSDIDQFHGLLKPSEMDGISWECSSVDSVRSDVVNLPLQSTQQFIEICIAGFKSHFEAIQPNHRVIPVYYCDENVTINDEIRKYASNLQSDEWKYFSGPKFSLKIANGNHLITVEKGIITESSIPEIIGMTFKDLTKNLKEFPFIDPNWIL